VRGASVKSQMCAVSHEKPGCFHSCSKMPVEASPAIVPPTPPCECTATMILPRDWPADTAATRSSVVPARCSAWNY
jgi:hypothetical protein